MVPGALGSPHLDRLDEREVGLFVELVETWFWVRSGRRISTGSMNDGVPFVELVETS